MRFASAISTAVFAMALGLPFAASAQSEEDVQYASFVLLCEARYESKGPAEVADFWREERGDLTPAEVAVAQRTMGSISDALANVNDDIVVKRCEELLSAIIDPDGFVDERSPELIAVADRMTNYIDSASVELLKSGFEPEYLSEMVSITVSLSNNIKDELSRSKIIERYFLSVIHGLAEQRQAIEKVKGSKKKTKALMSVSPWCPKSFIKDLPKAVKASADAGEYDEAVTTAVQSVLLDGLVTYLKRENPADASQANMQALANKQEALKQKENLTEKEAITLNTLETLIVTSCLSGKMAPTLERTVHGPAEKAEALATKEIASYETKKVSN